MSWQSAITLALAVLGAALGVINTWHGLNRDKVRLRIRPISVVTSNNPQMNFGIEVANLSTFAVTVEEVGFTLGSRSAKKGHRAAILLPLTSDGGPWPRRLQPHESVTLYFASADYRELGHRDRAYARTAGWEYAYGETPALEGLRR